MISTKSQQNRPVLLLGGTGRLGRILTRFWPGRSDLVVQSRRSGDADLVFDPLHDPVALAEAVGRVRAVICLAGVTHAHAAQTGDAMSLNADLALATLRTMPPGARVFLASSAAVYGAAPGVCRETDGCAPLSDYGRAKLEMEQAAAGLGKPFTALRIGNVAGADAILGGWRDGMQIDRLPDGTTPSRSYIGPQTLARVLHALTVQDSLPQVLNIAAPGVIEMGALLDAAGLGWAPRPAPEGVIARVELCTTRLARHVSFAPEDSTATGMVAEWQAMKGHS